MTTPSYQNKWTRGDLLSALAQGQFVPYLQPKIDLISGAVVGAEVLARWEHPIFGTLLPTEFIALMEQEALIDLLTTNVLQQSLIYIKYYENN